MMVYMVINPLGGEKFEFAETDLTSAQTKQAELKTVFLANEAYRFSVAKEIVNGNDTTWTTADLNNDPEDNHYHVFNTYTGQHELVTSLSQAKAKRAELMEKFATDSGLGADIKLVDTTTRLYKDLTKVII